MSSAKSKMSRLSKDRPQDMGVELEIDGFAGMGRGIGRKDGVVWFVPGAVPGDRVRAEAVRHHPRYVEGRLLGLLRPSAERREPPCRLQESCGGCPLMPVEEGVQREWRRRFVVDALERIGGFTDPPVEPIREASAALGYRNRVELLLGAHEGGTPFLGLHARDAAVLVDVDRCLLQAEPGNAVLSTIRASLAALGVVSGNGRYRLSIRRSEATGEMLVALHEIGPPLDGALDLARAIRSAHPEVVGFVRLRGRSERRGGMTTEVLLGQGWIEERIAGVSYRLPAATFVQVSRAAAEELSRLVQDVAGPRAASVLDLYGGVGVHALTLVATGRAGSAVSVDADPSAVECGIAAARSARLDVRFVQADVGRFLSRERGRYEVIVANPPRTGMASDVTAALAALGPARLVVVSCEPTTLARDLRRLIDGGGYRLERLVPVDVFPQTAHVETVSLLTR
jgi:23S rRNA (uracil1939-C5)-methyltransferase